MKRKSNGIIANEFLKYIKYRTSGKDKRRLIKIIDWMDNVVFQNFKN